MTRSDVANLDIEVAGQPNVVLLAARLAPGGCVGPDGSVDLERLRAEVAARLAADDAGVLRRLGQRIDLDHRPPAWRPCTPDLSWHVRRAAPAVRGARGPVGAAALAALCARLVTEPLLLDRPPWELLVVPGASGEEAALVIRLHHAVADGVGGMALVEALFGATDDSAGPLRAPAPSAPPRAAATTRARRTLRSARRTATVLRHSVGPTPLLGDVGPVRGVGFVEVDLHGLATRAGRAGATVNDALLAAVAGAVGDALRRLGEPVPATLPVSVPVALPQRGGSGNATGVMLVCIPTAERDVRARTRKVARLTAGEKEVAREQGTVEPTRHRWSTRLFARFARHQRLVAAFVSNIRGPAHPLHVAGAPVTGLWATGALQGNVRLGVTALSYGGVLRCTVHVDAAALPLDVLRASLETALHRLAGQRHPAAPARARTHRPARAPAGTGPFLRPPGPGRPEG